MAPFMNNESTNLVIFAPGIHTGGGLTLLRAILESEVLKHLNLSLFLDTRLLEHLDPPPNAGLYEITPSFLGRLKAEIALKQRVGETDTVLCLHSLPPLFRLHGRTVCFLQNVLHFGEFPLFGYAAKTRLRLTIERLIASIKKSQVDTYIVQTKSMEQRLRRWHRNNPHVIVCPFTSRLPGTEVDRTEIPPRIDFLYIADGQDHKNHINLIQAWILLAEQGIYPKLGLTLSPRDDRLRSHIDEMRTRHRLQIENYEMLALEDIPQLYRSSRALIFPSRAESLGLPLIEASQFNLPIIASELDYVRDICRPAETFDPSSPLSIARAVRRFLSLDEEIQPLQSPDTFIRTAMSRDALEPVEDGP